MAERLDRRVVQPIDATDCGWGTVEGTRPQLSFSAVISGFNPGASASPAERDAAFEAAVMFAQQVLRNELRSAEEFVAAKEEVLAAPAQDRILTLSRFVPWAEHVFARPDEANILYVVFPSERGGWMVQQVPKKAGSFEGRKPLPVAWAGLSGESFAKVAGLSSFGSATFCHPGRFVCGGETRQDALALATAAVAAE